MDATPTSISRPLTFFARILLLAGLPLAHAQAQPTTPPPSSPGVPPIVTKPTSDPADDAALNDDSVESARDSLLERGHSRILYPTSQVRTSPTSPEASVEAAVDAGLPSIDPNGPRPPLMAEGAFVVRKRGVLMVTDWGAYIFSFAPNADVSRERPVAILPCETLRRMESAAGASGERVPAGSSRVVVIGAFILSGQVTVYQGRNYLLPTAFSLTEDLSPARVPTTSPADAAPTDHPPDADPEISELIGDLESLRTAPRGASSANRSDVSSDSAPPVADDTLIPRRKARLIRTGRGEAAIAFDSGASGSSDAPMILLPCAATEGIERAAARAGDGAIFDISGRAFQHQGRNYLLPLMYIAETSRNVKPLH